MSRRRYGMKVRNSSIPWMVIVLGITLAGCSHPDSDSVSSRKQANSANVARATQVPANVATETKPTGSLPAFEDIHESFGVNFTREDDIRGQHRLLEANGGGVALFDFDNDGWPDIFFTNGCRLPRSESINSTSNCLYRNRGKEGFENVTESAGLTATGYWQGCTSGDFDGDGFEDLYVAAFGTNALLQNQGDGTFRDVTIETGTSVGKWSSSPAFSDLNLDGNLDLFVVTYVETSDSPPTLCPESASRDGYVQCSPTMFRASEDILFLSDGSGGFINATEAAGVAGVDGKGLGIAIFDIDGDYRPEIFVANDGTPNFLYCRTSQPDAQDVMPLKFADRAFEKGVAVSQRGKAQAGMGIAVADVDGDGWSDIYVSNFYGEPDSLYRNQEGHSFEDVSNSSGVGPPSRSRLGFGVEFIDFENDGWPDLFVTNGHVDDLTSFTSVPYRMRPLVFRSRHDGKFLDVTSWAGSYCQQNWLGRGLATSDLDRDGRVDIVISHQRAPSAVLHNETRECHQSCRLRLVGTGTSNRSAFHATIKLEGIDGPPVRQVIGGGSFQSASDRTVHIGMGAARSIPRITIRWPDGMTDTHLNMSSGSFVIVQGRQPVPISTP